jgi:hypothetical protein
VAKYCHHTRLWHDNARCESLEKRGHAARANSVVGGKVGLGARSARSHGAWVGELGGAEGHLKSRAARACLARLEHRLERQNALHLVLLAVGRVVTTAAALARLTADFLDDWRARDAVRVECGHHLVTVLVTADVRRVSPWLLADPAIK